MITSLNYTIKMFSKHITTQIYLNLINYAYKIIGRKGVGPFTF